MYVKSSSLLPTLCQMFMRNRRRASRQRWSSQRTSRSPRTRAMALTSMRCSAEAASSTFFSLRAPPDARSDTMACDLTLVVRPLQSATSKRSPRNTSRLGLLRVKFAITSCASWLGVGDHTSRCRNTAASRDVRTRHTWCYRCECTRPYNSPAWKTQSPRRSLCDLHSRCTLEVCYLLFLAD